MKLRELLKMSEDNPDMLDYTLCMSSYFLIPGRTPVDNEQLVNINPEEFANIDIDPEELTVIWDNPIRGIATNDESKEIRFILNNSDISACDKSPDNIKKLWGDSEEEDQD